MAGQGGPKKRRLDAGTMLSTCPSRKGVPKGGELKFPDGWEDDLARQALQNALPKYRAAVAGATCPDHPGSVATVVVTAKPKKPDIEIHGCCGKLGAAAAERIKQAGLGRDP